MSFVVVTFGTDFEIVDECLRRLASSLVADGVSGEVIVVDNPHPDLGHRCADHLTLTSAGIRLVRPERNLGFGGGNELGLLLARSDVFCLLNPDLMVHDGWLPPLLDLLAEHPDSIVAPRLVERDGTLQEAGQCVRSDGTTAPAVAGATPSYASAACWLMTERTHATSGGFDPRFHPAYFEDVDLALRVRRVGGGLIVSDSVAVIHDHGRSTPSSVHDVSVQHRQFIELWVDWLADEAAHTGPLG